jgi:hypothetical protein
MPWKGGWGRHGWLVGLGKTWDCKGCDVAYYLFLLFIIHDETTTPLLDSFDCW